MDCIDALKFVSANRENELDMKDCLKISIFSMKKIKFKAYLQCFFKNT